VSWRLEEALNGAGEMSSSINIRLVAAIVAASVVTGCSRPSTARDERDAALAANVDVFATKSAASDEFSGVVLLTRHGQPLVRRGYGLADRKAGRPNTLETPFMLSSVSKMFTAVTIAKLVERKQLSFDSTLGSLLPEYPSAEARDQVTVRHLLTMSSGIPDLFRVPEFWAEVATIKSPMDLWKFFATSPLQFRSVPEPNGLTVTPTSFCWEPSSNDAPAARLRRWSRPSYSARSVWRVLDMKLAALPSRRLAIRVLHLQAPVRIPLAGIQLGRSPSQATIACPAARWAVATRPPTTWPILPTRS
jgi:beta-lactamase family protein